MTTVHHLNCGILHAQPFPPAARHCLLLNDPAGLALVDAGIGLHDVRDPSGSLRNTPRPQAPRTGVGAPWPAGSTLPGGARRLS
jgi:hypothetical protein